jgi:hypothetical protein
MPTSARLKVSLSDKSVSLVFERKGYRDETGQVGTPYASLVVLEPALPTVK